MWRPFTACLVATLALPGQAQLLRDPEAEAPPQQEQSEAPLVLREAGNETPPQPTVDDAIEQLRREMREIADAALTEAERADAYRELYERNAPIFRRDSTPAPAETALTVDTVVQQLETLIFEVALDAAPDEAARQRVLDDAPRHLMLEPHRPVSSVDRRPVTPVFILRDPEAEGDWWGDARVDAEALALDEVTESPEEQLEAAVENLDKEDKEDTAVAVEVLVDEKTTVELHDTATILREVESDAGDLVLFDALHVWAGGAVQFDAYSFDDVFNANNGGESKDSTSTRRAEVIVRSTLLDFGEIRLQYDLDGDFWRDLYYRWADTERDFVLTVGNQTEPMSQERILGNKFNAAMEASAPSSTFANYRGLGVSVNKWLLSSGDEPFLGLLTKPETAVTAAFGIFGEDIENTNDTDLAATGRLTWGRLGTDGVGLHLGLSGTYRDGEFDRINPRPELAEADRIILAAFDADRAAVLGFEALYTKGSLHASSEWYLADYHGGEIDGQGFGGFFEVGYYLTGQERRYRPKWGLWAPLQVGARNIFEVFGRVSYTYGDADEQSSNDLGMITLGGSWYRHKFRTSINLLYGSTDNQIGGEDSGFGASMRVQYLF